MIRRILPWITLSFAAVFLGGLSFFYYQNHFQNSFKPAPDSQLTAILSAPPHPLQLDAREKTTLCEINGPLPDHACTPGSVFNTVAENQICAPGYTKTVRSVAVSLKKKVYAEYGLSYPRPKGAYEVDHLIPLELGGDNNIANLFPEAAEPAPGFREKDLVENFLNQEVCAGRTALSTAQEQIAKNWLKVYNGLSPEQIRELKQQFASWADN